MKKIPDKKDHTLGSFAQSVVRAQRSEDRESPGRLQVFTGETDRRSSRGGLKENLPSRAIDQGFPLVAGAWVDARAVEGNKIGLS